MTTEHQYLDRVNRGDFDGLFIEDLGWGRPAGGGRVIAVEYDGNEFEVWEAATISGISAWVCSGLPDGRTQREIDRHVRRQSTERLVIFYDEHRQQWRWPQTSESTRTSARLVTHDHTIGRSNPALEQRLRLIEVGIEEDPSVVEVHRRLRAAFDAERVTKRFYKEFAEHHIRLCDSIQGIAVPEDVRWYSSLLLNRLMFLYFIQRKGFLDNNLDYLADRLAKVRALSGTDRFFDFYRDFLLPLFHEGLGTSLENRVFPDDAVEDLVGDIPYVNGGIFEKHPLEELHEIRIPDTAFEQIFRYFDQWQWHLNDRATGEADEINPDVLGHIFEQFITGATQKSQGAYYTKEDVTDYMTASTVVPLFLERLQTETGVNPWRLISQEPSRYIWDSVTHGTAEALPETVQQAVAGPPTASTVMDERLPVEFALPGESWWEVADRRQWATQLNSDMAAGKVSSPGVAITSNLDLESLAVDCIDRLDNPADIVPLLHN